MLSTRGLFMMQMSKKQDIARTAIVMNYYVKNNIFVQTKVHQILYRLQKIYSQISGDKTEKVFLKVSYFSQSIFFVAKVYKPFLRCMSRFHFIKQFGLIKVASFQKRSPGVYRWCMPWSMEILKEILQEKNEILQEKV